MSSVLQFERIYKGKLFVFWNHLYQYSIDRWANQMSHYRSRAESKPVWMATGHPINIKLPYDKVDANSTHISILLQALGLHDGGMENVLEPIGMINVFSWSESKIRVVMEYKEFMKKDVEAWWEPFALLWAKQHSREHIADAPTKRLRSDRVKNIAFAIYLMNSEEIGVRTAARRAQTNAETINRRKDDPKVIEWVRRFEDDNQQATKMRQDLAKNKQSQK
jgi:hypothetical protein